MGEVIPLFRDRRGKDNSPKSPIEIDVTYTKNSLHDHLRDLHGWGGPRSSTRATLDRVHENDHRDPAPWTRPHRHV